MRALTGAQALLRALRGMGVERIYASPGSDWAPVWEALAGPDANEFPRYFSSRHEETAVAMANGYAKASGKLPAVMLHTTVGALHAAMAIRIALHERVPMVVLAGGSIAFGEPPAPLVGRQWLRLLTDVGGPTRLIEPCVKWSFALDTAALLPQAMQRACQLALAAPRGPVFVGVPTEYLLEETSGPPAGPAALASPAAADPKALDELAAALSAARHPLIITEEAGRDPAAVTNLVSLAELLGAKVIEGWQPYYFNFPRRHPLYGGVVADGIADAVAHADAILLADCVVPWHPPSSLPKNGAKVFAIGEDPLRSNLPYWGVPTHMVVPGELRTTLEGLVGRIQTKRAFSSARPEAARVEAKTRIDTRWAAHILNDVLPKNAVVVNETITHRPELLKQLTNLEPGGWLESSFGGLGVGIASALGVKHARPDRTVIVTIGDGAFHYNPVVASLAAAQEHGLPILVLVFDNAGYLSQKGDVANYFPDGHAVRTRRFVGTSITPAPDYVKLAEAYGGCGERVEQPGELRAALERGLKQVAAGRLALVDIVLEPVDP